MHPGLSRSRFIVGAILIVMAVVMLVFLRGRVSTAGAIAILILGLASVAISKRQ
jgi:hypothetical protein